MFPQVEYPVVKRIKITVQEEKTMRETMKRVRLPQRLNTLSSNRTAENNLLARLTHEEKPHNIRTWPYRTNKAPHSFCKFDKPELSVNLKRRHVGITYLPYEEASLIPRYWSSEGCPATSQEIVPVTRVQQNKLWKPIKVRMMHTSQEALWNFVLVASLAVATL